MPVKTDSQPTLIVKHAGRLGHAAHHRSEGGANLFRRNTFRQLLPQGHLGEQMKRGVADVLWPGKCSFYAVSSGTTAGPTKYIPVTFAMFAHFRRAGL